MKIRLTALARRDLIARVEYLSEDAPDAATQFLVQLDAALALLARTPRAGRAIQLRGLRAPVQRWPLPPMVIYYAERGAELVVYRVRHERRRPIER